MKQYIILLAIVLTSACAFSQKSVDKIFKQLKSTPNYYGASVPFWLVRPFIKLSDQSIVDHSEFVARQIIKGIKSVRIGTTTLDENKFNLTSIMSSFKNYAIEMDKFEEYISVRHASDNVKILIKQEGDIVKNILIVNTLDGGQLTAVHIKSKLNLDDLAYINFKNIHKNTL